MMFKSRQFWRWQLPISLVCFNVVIVWGVRVRAQIAPDATLGAESSRVTSPDNINFQIVGGAARGGNLFHSFSQFSVPLNGSAYFRNALNSNALNIKNIIGRVTGDSVSNINGLLRADGTANLFLINPNGIIFGPSASLRIGGSFLASTASSLIFADGTQLSTTVSQTPPLLTISTPLGLQFNSRAAGIRVQGSVLAVPSGKTLALVGGEIAVEGGTLALAVGKTNPQVGGRIELGSVAGNSFVDLTPIDPTSVDKGWALGYQSVQNFQDIQLSQGSLVDVTAKGGGDIQVQGRCVILTDGSDLVTNTEGSQPGGTLAVRASNSVELIGTTPNGDNVSGLSASVVKAGATGAGGNITIETGCLIVRDGAVISVDTSGVGRGGNLTVKALDSVAVIGTTPNGGTPSALSALVKTGATGAGGNITIETGRLIVQDGARVSADVRAGATGAGGNITIETGRLIVQDGARVSVDTFGAGRGGNLIVRALDSVAVIGASANGGKLSSSSLSASVNPGATGASGDITIETKQLVVQDGAQIRASTFGSGQAGDLKVSASEFVKLIGATTDGQFFSGLYAQVNRGATGNGGNLIVKTGQLIVQGGAEISVATQSQGQGGTLNITALDSVELSGTAPTATESQGSSGLFVSAEPGASGKVGDLTISTKTLSVRNGAKISADNFGPAPGGNLTLNVNQLNIQDGGLVRAGAFSSGSGGTLNVNATESVQVSGTGTIGSDRVSSTLLTQTQAAGNAGDLRIATGSLSVRAGANVTVSSAGSGKAGNLQITAPSIGLDRGVLTAEALSGNGGNITLQQLDLLLMRHGSQISTTAGTAQAPGNGGNITIDAKGGFIVAIPSEDSDIRANAYTGRGGNVRITAQGLFGIQFRPQDTPLSDITASSTLGINGVVEISTPGIDPSRGIANLPAQPIVAQVAQGCYAGGSQAESKFTVTGRGGLPPNPQEALRSDAVDVGWVRLDATRGEQVRSEKLAQSSLLTPYSPLVEAQSWAINAKGEVVLTADAPIAPHNSWQTLPKCDGL